LNVRFAISVMTSTESPTARAVTLITFSSFLMFVGIVAATRRAAMARSMVSSGSVLAVQRLVHCRAQTGIIRTVQGTNRAATVSSRISLLNTLPRLASWAALSVLDIGPFGCHGIIASVLLELPYSTLGLPRADEYAIRAAPWQHRHTRRLGHDNRPASSWGFREGKSLHELKLRTGHQHTQNGQTKGQTTVWRRAVLQGVDRKPNFSCCSSALNSEEY